MEVRIGIVQSPRELTFETDVDAAALQQTVAHAMTSGEPLVTFTDTKGKQYFVATGSISFIELGGESNRKVGFIN